MQTNRDIFWVRDVQPTGKVLRTRYRNSTLTLARFRHDGSAERVYRGVRDDAFVAIIQLIERPAHVYEFGGAPVHGEPGPANSFNFADLSAEPSCRIHGPLDNLHLHIPRSALHDIADEADSPPIDGLHATDGWDTGDPILDHLKQTMVALNERSEEASQLFVDHLILALHAHFARCYGGMRDAQRKRIGGLAPWQLRRAKDLIASNLAGELSVTAIARECGLSAAHFSRAFKSSTGITPHAWLQGCRIEHAKTMLKEPGLSLAEIAVASGFSDQSHFTRVFTRNAGDTPGAWRRNRLAA